MNARCDLFFRPMSSAVLATMILFSSASRADVSNVDAIEGDKHYDNFYSINENQTQNFGFQDPVQYLGQQGKEAVVYLLSWLHHDQEFADPVEPYKRTKHFGTWIVRKSEHPCMNTRALVLLRDAKGNVQTDERDCRVVSGEWQDPYAGDVITDAKEIQIDHMVPLKNAYLSGASTWDYDKRCLYANFMQNGFHLLAVSGHENMKKSDMTPAGYMPPVEEYACQYLQNWLKIKLIWGLVLNPDEASAIQKFSEMHNCQVQFMSLPIRDLLNQRKQIIENMDLCRKLD